MVMTILVIVGIYIAVGVLAFAFFFIKNALGGGRQTQYPALAAASMAERLVYERATGKFLPQKLSEGIEVIDFWYTIYHGNSETSQKLSQGALEKLLSASHEVELKDVAFSSEVFRGKSRPLYVIKRNVARATLNISLLGNQEHVYVSLRLLFQGTISGWKSFVLFVLSLFLAIPPALIGFWPIWGELGFEKTEHVWGGGTQVSADWGNAMWAFFIALFVSAVVISMIRQLWSLWRYGDSRALEREDLDELYRDDLAALGTEIILAVTEVADELDLKQLTIAGEKPPALAVHAQTNRTKRKPRF